MRFQLRTARQLLQGMIDSVVSTSALTDIVDGSDLKQVLAAVARVGEQLSRDIARMLTAFNLDRLEGPDLDRRAAEYLPAGLERRTGLHATGTLRFSRQAGASPIPIPVGTLAASGAVLYVTTAPGQVPAGPDGTLSLRTDGGGGDIPARAVKAGPAGNAAVDTVRRLVSTLPGVRTVTNPVPFREGADAETDDALRARIRQHVQSLARSTSPALVERVKAAQLDERRIQAALAVEDPARPGWVGIYVDDGLGSVESAVDVAGETYTAIGGERRLRARLWPWRVPPESVVRTPEGGVPVVLELGVDYRVWASEGFIHFDATAFPDGLATGDVIALGDYQAFTGLVREAQRLISGDPTEPATYPAWRAGGVEAAVLPARVFDVDVELTTAILTGYDRTSTVAAVRQVISTYVNGLAIGADVIVAEIVERVMGVPGLYDCTVIQPAANVVVGDLEVARLQTENMEVS